MKTPSPKPVLIVQETPRPVYSDSYPNVFVATVGTLDPKDGTPRNGMSDYTRDLPGIGFQFAIYRGASNLVSEYSIPCAPRNGSHKFATIARTLKKLEEKYILGNPNPMLGLIYFCEVLKIQFVVSHDGAKPAPHSYQQWNVKKTPVAEFALKLAEEIK